MTHVMVVDDDPGLSFTLKEILESECDYTVDLYANPADALRTDLAHYDVILTDLMMPGELDGMDFLKQVRATHTQIPIIMLTAHGSESLAVEAMKQGAWDYIQKPFELDELVLTTKRAAFARHMQRKANEAAAREVLGESFVATSQAMKTLVRAVERVAPRDITVLLTGPTGSGKEVIGSLIHAYSGRAAQPLVRFNCAAIPKELAESELFGHQKGAFTGATQAREGYFQRAHGGTLILDEVGELPLEIQSKLLRVFTHGEVQPVGASRMSHVDVRIVACTHRDLGHEVSVGRFREDLYYRLAVVKLRVPGLSERTEEIEDLVAHFAQKYCQKFGLERMIFDEDVLHMWKNRTWRGHVRELENAVASAIAMSSSERITRQDLLPTEPSAHHSPQEVAMKRGFTQDINNLNFRKQIHAFERHLLKQAMQQSDHNQTRAAQALGMARTTLIDKLKRHDLYPEKP